MLFRGLILMRLDCSPRLRKHQKQGQPLSVRQHPYETSRFYLSEKKAPAASGRFLLSVTFFDKKWKEKTQLTLKIKKGRVVAGRFIQQEQVETEEVHDVAGKSSSSSA